MSGPDICTILDDGTLGPRIDRWGIYDDPRARLEINSPLQESEIQNGIIATHVEHGWSAQIADAPGTWGEAPRLTAERLET